MPFSQPVTRSTGPLCTDTTARPHTYDFIVHMLVALGAELEEVRVEVLKDPVFYGIAQVCLWEAVQQVDARPSDVLALAVRAGCPIYVAEEMLAQAGLGRENLEQEFGPISPARARQR